MNVETAPDDPKKLKLKTFSAQKTKTKKQIEDKRRVLLSRWIIWLKAKFQFMFGSNCGTMVEHILHDYESHGFQFRRVLDFF